MSVAQQVLGSPDQVAGLRSCDPAETADTIIGQLGALVYLGPRRLIVAVSPTGGALPDNANEQAALGWLYRNGYASWEEAEEWAEAGMRKVGAIESFHPAHVERVIHVYTVTDRGRELLAEFEALNG